MKEEITKGGDAHLIKPGFSYTVPVFPVAGVFVEVNIASCSEIPTAFPMRMEYTTDLGAQVEVPLGYWSEGEGMGSINAVIVDWVKSKIRPKDALFLASGAGFDFGIITPCRSKTHNLKNQRLLEEQAKNRNWRQKCLWNIVMEGCCTVCLESSSVNSSDNFGIDDSLIARPSNGSISSMPHTSTYTVEEMREQLRQRYARQLEAYGNRRA